MMLSPDEVRVLGCLIEKELTTPAYYPLTLNSLTAACSQKSNRHPVVAYDEQTVVRALDSLREKGLANKVYKADSRVAKYEHGFTGKYDLSEAETALMCELMLRGAQTAGELRSRADRMHGFASLEEVNDILQGLMQDKMVPMVVLMPRQAGRKERRYMHLLCGEPDMSEEFSDAEAPAEPARLAVAQTDRRIEALEAQVQQLTQEVQELRQELERFRAEFM